jgi:hypothetical protein
LSVIRIDIAQRKVPPPPPIQDAGLRIDARNNLFAATLSTYVPVAMSQPFFNSLSDSRPFFMGIDHRGKEWHWSWYTSVENIGRHLFSYCVSVYWIPQPIFKGFHAVLPKFAFFAIKKDLNVPD